MPEYQAPGVYIEAIERGPRPVAGVPTGVAAFLGETERGPLHPRLVTSYSDYSRWYGGPFREQRYMPYAANGFFENGGKQLYICRIAGAGATTAQKTSGDFAVKAVGPGAWGRRVWYGIQDGSSAGFRLKLAYWPALESAFQPYDPFDPQNRLRSPRPQYVEDHDNLSVDPSSPDFFEKRLFDSTTRLPVSSLAFLERVTRDTTSHPPNNDPNGEFLDEDGIDDAIPLDGEDYAGGLAALELDAFRDVALVYAPFPSENAIAIAKKVIDHCQRLRFRFAVIDAPNSEPADLDPRTSIQDTAWAAFYAPWIVASGLQTNLPQTIPPGGHVLGVYARTDLERGVFKAPANEVVRGALDLRFHINDNLQSVLNLRGVNVIRRFPGRGIRVWGARTLSPDNEWKYVNLRRYFIFLEHSIDKGTQWVVFEANDEKLWARVTDAIRLFLRSQWRDGALRGRTENEAFFVRCDRTTMTQDDILNGRLICEIGIAPTKPAEFVIFRIFQHTVEAHR